MIKLYKLVLFIVGVSLFTILSGCSLLNHEKMIVKPTNMEEINPKLKKFIVVDTVYCAKKLYAFQVPIVDDMLNNMTFSKVFKKALENSLNEYGYLAGSADKGKYDIEVILQRMEAPFKWSGVIDMKSTIAYKISGPDTDKEYTITAVGKATGSDAFWGSRRAKIATERSIQANIKEFLKQLNTF